MTPGPNGCTCGFNGDCNCPFEPSAPEVLCTADDEMPVRVGDRVWQVHRGYASITCAKVQRHWLTMWRETLTGRLFATEQAAVALALEEAKERLVKAKAAVRNETRAIAKLRGRGK